jgi:protein-S-isoprenylcysteine O-methyltransferase Ste14
MLTISCQSDRDYQSDQGTPMESQAMTEPKPSGWRALLRPRYLDRFEQVAILVLWCWLVYRVVHAVQQHQAPPWALLVLVAETSVLFFTLIRRPTDNISVNWRDWALATTATFLPLLVQTSDNGHPSLLTLAVLLIIAGNCFQVMAKLFLRRSFGLAPANRGVKVDGPYRLMRHPMYAGYLVIHIGNLILFPLWINVALYGASWAVQIMRLLAEERLLAQDPAYAAYMQKVRWRLLPGVF